MNWIYNSERLSKYVKMRLPHDVDFGECQAMGLEKDGVIFGAVVFNNYFGRDIELSIAIDNALCFRPEYCDAIFDYVYNTAGCERATCRVHSGNKRSIKFMEKFGFKYEGRKREFYPDGDALLYGMLKGEYYGRKRT